MLQHWAGYLDRLREGPVSPSVEKGIGLTSERS
jgi:hypothetical protein